MITQNLKISGMDAAIFDMDGVVTKTARIHKRAWKQLFDDFLNSEVKDEKKKRPFSDDDYKKYIDGIPRYDGVSGFLKSRDIELPYGDPSDDENKNTICGLGNRKNRIFLNLIDYEGVEIYTDAVNQINDYRKHGIKTAVISSSKNCREILTRAGIINIFDVVLDGVDSEQRGLKGKPAPDIFLEAAKELKVTPDRSVVFEDAIQGVQAGDNGDFAFVVGVDRNKNKEALLENGADVVFSNLLELDIFNNPEMEPYFTQKLPSLFTEFNKTNSIFKNRIPVFFFDYDGTLTPIVRKPQDAQLSKEMRMVLHDLAKKHTVAIVSGRDMDDVKSLVNLETLIYAGSHGFRISGPNGLFMEHEEAQKIKPQLDKVEKLLKEKIEQHITGSKIDRKRYAVAVHYRNVEKKHIDEVIDRVHSLAADYNELKVTEGKMILEIKPNLDWHKGKAIRWILKKLDLEGKENILPIYFGDDITDEDGFNTLADDGLGVLIGSHSSPTAARYALKNAFQLRRFLQAFNKHK
ncbi:MAG: trehalose-phosphatase [Bacteroidota bacterium]